MGKQRLLDRAKVLEILSYDASTGRFYWKINNGNQRKVGSEAGSKRADGYREIRIDGRLYLAHRLVWLVETGKWPPQGVDHINRDPGDNRFVNLRAASQAQNLQNKSISKNNTSGFTGVTWDRHANKWKAHIQKNRLQHHLGLFDTPEEAAEAYAAAKAQLHTFHPEVVQ